MIGTLSSPAILDAPQTAANRLDAVIWSLIAATAVIVALSVPIGGFHPVWESFIRPAGALLPLLAGRWFYANIRRSPQIATALSGTAQIVAFAAVAAPLSYIATAMSAPFPLQDHTFDVVDKAFGFDWRALLTWMDANSAVYAPLRTVYSSLTVQASIAILVLAFARLFVWLRIFMLAFIIAALIGLAASIAVPAHGAWSYGGLTLDDCPNILPVVRDIPVPIIDGLRDGSYRLLMAIGSEGIITFPSLHAAFAVILIVAFWPVPVLRWIGLAFDVLMLVATPVDGSHYLVDIFAGLAVAAVAVSSAWYLAMQFMISGNSDAALQPAARPAAR